MFDGGQRVAGSQRGRSLAHPALESMQVDLAGVDGDDVAGTARLNRRLAAEQLPQLRHLPLHLGDRRHRRFSAVEVVCEPVDRHYAVCAQEQNGERRSLPDAAEFERPVVAYDLERPEETEVEHQLVPRLQSIPRSITFAPSWTMRQPTCGES